MIDYPIDASVLLICVLIAWPWPGNREGDGYPIELAMTLMARGVAGVVGLMGIWLCYFAFR